MPIFCLHAIFIIISAHVSCSNLTLTIFAPSSFHIQLLCHSAVEATISSLRIPRRFHIFVVTEWPCRSSPSVPPLPSEYFFCHSDIRALNRPSTPYTSRNKFKVWVTFFISLTRIFVYSFLLSSCACLRKIANPHP